MAGGTSVSLLHDIQVLFDAGTASGLSDRQLLERFISRGDASAFELLVQRHGPMVLRVCRNRLSDPNDAQDAFQATFLILVRRSGSIRRLDSLGSWLYGVASRVSARLRAGAARRRGAEERAAALVLEAVDASGGIEVDREEFGPIVQEEVRRLPEKYRAVVVLCYWEGLTHEQAAVQLGVPLGTVRSRMARARDLLRRRLTRRGLGPLSGTIAALDGIPATDSVLRLTSVPADLVRATVQAAVRVAAGQTASQVVSGAVASLVQHVIWSITMIKVSSVVVSVVLVGLVGYGVGTVAQQAGQPRAVGPVVDNKGGQDGQPSPPQTQDRKESAPEPKAALIAGSPSAVVSGVEGESTVISVRRGLGMLVKEGDVLCELDSRPIRDQLPGQFAAIETARAAYLKARLTREVAEIAEIEYKEGIFLQELEDVEGDIKLAEAELALAEDVMKAAKDEGADKKLALKRAELDVFRAKTAIKKVQARRRVLVEYTKHRIIKQLYAEVEKARGDELSKKAIFEMESRRESRLERQIASCVIKAPIDGTIQRVTINPGERVLNGQILFQIMPAPQSKPQHP